MNYRTTIFLLFFCIFFGSINQVYGFGTDKTYIMVDCRNQQSPQAHYLRVVYTEAFRRLGYELDIQYHPTGQECTHLSQRGLVDGELSREKRYARKHKKLVRLTYPHYQTSYHALSWIPELEIYGWQSLKNRLFKVAYQRPDKTLERKLTREVPLDKLTAVDDLAAGLELLKEKRVDAFVVDELELGAVKKHPLHERGRIAIAGIMEKYSAHAYLHNKNGHLAKPLSITLYEMKKEGLLDQYLSDAGNPDNFTDSTILE